MRDTDHGYYRHSCDVADDAYESGFTLVFFDAEVQAWVLTQISQEALASWEQAPAQPPPLSEWRSGAYSACTEVDFCPFCGVALADAPVVAMADAGGGR